MFSNLTPYPTSSPPFLTMKSYTPKKCPHCNKTFKVLKRHIDNAHYNPERNAIVKQYQELLTTLYKTRAKARNDVISTSRPEPPRGKDGYEPYMRWWREIEDQCTKHPDVVKLQNDKAADITAYVSVMTRLNVKYGYNKLDVKQSLNLL